MSLPKTIGIFRIHTKEIRYTNEGTAILNLNLVASSKYKTKAGTEKEDVCWITATSFARQAEIINQHFNEKDRIFILGNLVQESWTTQDNQKRSKHVLKIDSFEFIERRDNPQQNNNDNPGRHNVSDSTNRPAQHQQQAPTQNQQGTSPAIDIEESNIPFKYLEVT